MLSLLALIAMAPCQDTSFVLQRGLGVSVESLSGLIEIRAGSGDQISVQGGDVHVGRRSVAIESITSGTMRVTMPRWA